MADSVNLLGIKLILLLSCFWIRGWDWWARRFDGYFDFLLTILVGELQLWGYEEYAQYLFWFHWITKPIVKNGKLWFDDIRTRDPVRAFVFFGILFMLVINYALFYRHTAEFKEGWLNKGVLRNLVWSAAVASVYIASVYIASVYIAFQYPHM